MVAQASRPTSRPFSRSAYTARSVLTAVTAQNTVEVAAIAEVPDEVVIAQIDTVAEDIGADAVKTGMLSNRSIIQNVADRLEAWGIPWLVVDPVMVSKSGVRLLQANAVDALKSDLPPLASIVTPNIPEAEVLAGMTIATTNDMRGRPPGGFMLSDPEWWWSRAVTSMARRSISCTTVRNSSRSRESESIRRTPTGQGARSRPQSPPCSPVGVEPIDAIRLRKAVRGGGAPNASRDRRRVTRRVNHAMALPEEIVDGSLCSPHEYAFAPDAPALSRARSRRHDRIDPVDIADRGSRQRESPVCNCDGNRPPIASCLRWRSAFAAAAALLNVPFIVNDRIDIALAAGADGVHLGVDDLPVGSARWHRRPGFHRRLFAGDRRPDRSGSQRLGATYLGIGPFAATTTKSDAGLPLGAAEFRLAASLTNLPVVAIGGIDRLTTPEALEAGANGIAVASAISRHRKPWLGYAPAPGVQFRQFLISSTRPGSSDGSQTHSARSTVHSSLNGTPSSSNRSRMISGFPHACAPDSNPFAIDHPMGRQVVPCHVALIAQPTIRADRGEPRARAIRP